MCIRDRTYTNEETHQIIRDNLDRSPLFSGAIEGTGPRYCPSIEDKVVKFPDKTRHPVSYTHLDVYKRQGYFITITKFFAPLILYIAVYLNQPVLNRILGIYAGFT